MLAFASLASSASSGVSNRESDQSASATASSDPKCSTCGGRDLTKDSCLTCAGKDRTKEPCSACGGLARPKGKCPFCTGSGRHDGKACPLCAGTGKKRPCEFCNGTGKRPACADCGGTGKRQPCILCHGRFIVLPAQKAKESATYLHENLELSQIEWRTENRQRYLTGRVVNRGGTTYSHVRVVFSLYDRSGAKVDDATAIGFDLKPGEHWTFREWVYSREAVRWGDPTVFGR
jgi:hypothetical protein